jgi:hypothetical protein
MKLADLIDRTIGPSAALAILCVAVAGAVAVFCAWLI